MKISPDQWGTLRWEPSARVMLAAETKRRDAREGDAIVRSYENRNHEKTAEMTVSTWNGSELVTDWDKEYS